MEISKVHLTNFRNYKKASFDFSPTTTVIVGPNASGKSNILESLYLLSTGKSYRARIEEEMIYYDTEIARVSASVDSGVWIADSEGTELSPTTEHQTLITSLEIILTRGKIGVGDNKFEKTPRKRLLINGVAKRLIDFAGIFKMVLFGPWDLDLVTESPSIRRKFLDAVLSQVDRDYRRAIMSYDKGLRQRNRLLLRIREEGLHRSQLMFWDKLLIKNGDYIARRREEYIEFVNRSESPDLSTNKRKIESHSNSQYCLVYDKSAISEARLEQYATEEIAAATTLVGPHRDDFIFKIKKQGNNEPKNIKELARYGSRGEQRMGVLWLKTAELAYIEQATGEKPTLLLDDIFSELDHEHRDIVMDIVKGRRLNEASGSESQQNHLHQGFGGQVIITTADPHFIEKLKVDTTITLK